MHFYSKQLRTLHRSSIVDVLVSPSVVQTWKTKPFSVSRFGPERRYCVLNLSGMKRAIKDGHPIIFDFNKSVQLLRLLCLVFPLEGLVLPPPPLWCLLLGVSETLS